MQLVALKHLLPLATLFVACESHRIDLIAARRQRAAAAERAAAAGYRTAQWAAYREVESDDRRFWSKEWNSLKDQLLQLQRVASEGGAAAVPPAGATDNATASQAKAVPAAGKGNATALDKAALPVGKGNATAPSKRMLLAGKGSPANNSHLENVAGLAPALAMLKGLYDDGKERIGKMNEREQDYKQKFEVKSKEHDAKLAEIDSRFKNGTLSKEFAVNETRDENRMWSYWQRVRERQHRQFHTSLKLQHATMDKVKSMIDLYEKVIAGKGDMDEVRQGLAKVSHGLPPDLVLLQAAERAAAHWCGEALVEVRASLTELDGHQQPDGRGSEETLTG